MTAAKNKSVHEQARDDTLVLCDAMIEAVFLHAPFDGWTPKALAAAEDSLMDRFGEGAGYRAFPGARSWPCTFESAQKRLGRRTLGMPSSSYEASPIGMRTPRNSSTSP